MPLSIVASWMARISLVCVSPACSRLAIDALEHGEGLRASAAGAARPGCRRRTRSRSGGTRPRRRSGSAPASKLASTRRMLASVWPSSVPASGTARPGTVAGSARPSMTGAGRRTTGRAGVPLGRARTRPPAQDAAQAQNQERGDHAEQDQIDRKTAGAHDRQLLCPTDSHGEGPAATRRSARCRGMLPTRASNALRHRRMILLRHGQSEFNLHFTAHPPRSRHRGPAADPARPRPGRGRRRGAGRARESGGSSPPPTRGRCRPPSRWPGASACPCWSTWRCGSVMRSSATSAAGSRICGRPGPAMISPRSTRFGGPRRTSRRRM